MLIILLNKEKVSFAKLDQITLQNLVTITAGLFPWNNRTFLWINFALQIRTLKIIFFCFRTSWAGRNTDLPWKTNSKQHHHPNVFERILHKLSKLVHRLIDFECVVLYWCFKVYGSFGISKIEILNFSGTERVKKGI